MIINMVGGGGGAALNFKVVPGLTQPGTASENTIWVKTERIGAWYFSATQPEGLQEWDVWFYIGTASAVDFNALKKNAVQVYPLSAKQYISGALVERTAKSYQNGEWVDWATWLFRQGEGAKADIQFAVGSKQTINTTNDAIVVGGNSSEVSSGANGTGVMVQTDDAYDLTNISKIYCRAKISVISKDTDENYQAAMCVFSSKPNGSTSSTAGSVAKTKFSVKEDTFELNVEHLKGNHWLALKGVFMGEIYDWYMM